MAFLITFIICAAVVGVVGIVSDYIYNYQKYAVEKKYDFEIRKIEANLKRKR